MGREAERIGSAFTISVGDNFYEEGVRSTEDPKWAALFEQIYTAPALQSRWDVILGNHDYRGDVQPQIDYSGNSPRWRMPARYYSRRETLADGTAVDFFYLDTAGRAQDGRSSSDITRSIRSPSGMKPT